MAGLLESLSAFTVFLSIAAFGFLFLLVSFLFGEIFDHLGFDHDGGHDGGDGPTMFSPRVVSVFVTAFGASGAIATFYGLNALPASLVGSVSGVVFGALIYYFARFLYGQQATTAVVQADFVGQTARVVVSIPKNGVGQVRCRVGEEMVDKVARSQSGEAIPENTPVHVEQVVGELIIVRRT